MKTIIQKQKRCYLCGTSQGLESHHIFGGPNRPKSEKYGLKVWLCRGCHTGPYGVHNQPALMKEMRAMGQEAFEAKYDEDFVSIFGRDYLNV